MGTYHVAPSDGAPQTMVGRPLANHHVLRYTDSMLAWTKSRSKSYSFVRDFPRHHACTSGSVARTFTPEATAHTVAHHTSHSTSAHDITPQHTTPQHSTSHHVTPHHIT